MTRHKGKCVVGCPKMECKEFLAEVVIKSHGVKALPDFGLGKGVLTRAEVTFNDVRGCGFDSPLFAVRKAETEQELLGDAVEVRWTEKKVRKR